MTLSLSQHLSTSFAKRAKHARGLFSFKRKAIASLGVGKDSKGSSPSNARKDSKPLTLPKAVSAPAPGAASRGAQQALSPTAIRQMMLYSPSKRLPGVAGAAAAADEARPLVPAHTNDEKTFASRAYPPFHMFNNNLENCGFGNSVSQTKRRALLPPDSRSHHHMSGGDK